MGNNHRNQKVTPLRPDQEVSLLKKKQRKYREVHRVRRNRIMAVILAACAILTFQLVMTKNNTRKVAEEVSQNQATLTKIKATNQTLKNKRDDMKDTDYVAKLIRYKYKYTKSGEKVYNVKEKSEDK
ncbi:G6F4N5 (Putative uncharacterized protein) [Lactobacillus equicursoris DSM 19284 = JCM 14600 = CIP 110162]|uniref:Septum formation initiator n=1 Tax=Lactobacillus equicursoris DSM 19284 = JCM 14600 = CIP 110162 TaxID=1293597 RepID=K0NY24_9LACO|nr:septum formation initiator family protein [Lactobacillus equicursoris]KRL01079.1 hypothetical protein FC20_GL000933 [Lactobacillus equicursoris DSM 19284 = JCM 14600 = CIP 110162]CCK86106.1 G6F4N5 (Putative uncharacterized protein) [Lactobacillus equicursoris DSM 19284 = JCM 14600 = CIP 110162]